MTRRSAGRDRRARARVACAAVAAALASAGCTDSSGTSPSPTSTTAESSPTSAPTASAPGPSESAALYSLGSPHPPEEGDAAAANTAVRSFATALGEGDRPTIEAALHAPTAEDPSVIDQSVRVLAGADWDFDGLRWSRSGVLGPCYVLRGTTKDGPVHIAGTAAWNDARNAWEFTTTGLPGSADYPDLPTC